jgi:hypothetical protein
VGRSKTGIQVEVLVLRLFFQRLKLVEDKSRRPEDEVEVEDRKSKRLRLVREDSRLGLVELVVRSELHESNIFGFGEADHSVPVA